MLALACLTLVLGACGRSGSPNTLVFAAGGAPAEVKVWKAMLAEYQAAHPGLKVVLRALPAASDLQLQAHTTALGSGKADYDLMRLDIVWLGAFAKKGWLQPLDELLPASQLVGFGPIMERSDRFQGKLLALPWNMDLGLLYSRADWLKAAGYAGPPRTWEDLAAMASAVTRALPSANGERPEGFVWQGKAYEGLLCNFMEYYAAAGGSSEAVEKSGFWEEGPALKALAFMHGLIRDGLSPPNTATELTEEPSRLLFQSGRAVFMRNWPYAQALAESADSKVAGKIWVSPLPRFKGGRRAAATLGGWHLAVRQGSPRAQEAAKLAAWLSAGPQQDRLNRELGWNPTRLGLYQELLQGPRGASLRPLKEAFLNVVNRPRVEGYAQFSERSVRIINAVLLGGSSPAEGAARLAAP